MAKFYQTTDDVRRLLYDRVDHILANGYGIVIDEENEVAGDGLWAPKSIVRSVWNLPAFTGRHTLTIKWRETP